MLEQKKEGQNESHGVMSWYPRNQTGWKDLGIYDSLDRRHVPDCHAVPADTGQGSLFH
jgi:hypothetical protein